MLQHRQETYFSLLWAKLAFVFMALLLLTSVILPQAMAQAQKPTLPEHLKKLELSTFFPGAAKIGAPEGDPMMVRVYAAGDKQIGYIYSTTDVVNTRGYSSKPIDVLVGLDNDGKIVGAKLVHHSEPIVLIGIPESKVDTFIEGYIGLNYLADSSLLTAQPPSDIVSGATVTLLVIGESIKRSILRMANVHGIGQAQLASQEPKVEVPKRIIDPSVNDIKSWDELLAEGAVGKLHITVAQINEAFEKSGRKGAGNRPERGAPDDVFVDMYAAVVSSPSLGRSLLGDAEWDHLSKRLKPGQEAIVVAGNGIYSFKGSGYVRGGIFDRIEVIQNDSSFHFTDLQHNRLGDLMAKGAPRFKEIALFTTPIQEPMFDATQPWRLQLMVQRVLSVQEKSFVTYDLNYQLPERYSMLDPNAPAPAPAQAVVAAAPAAGTVAPATSAPATADVTAVPQYDETSFDEPLWKQIWHGKIAQIVTVIVALIILIGVFFFQQTLARHETFYERFRIVFLCFSLFYIGWYLQAQLSIVNVLTFTTAIRTEFSWEYFLMDPIVFILWCATAISMVFWNRGAFCGWLCPFGSLQELLNIVAKKIGIPQLNVPHAIHTRLAALKYVIFVVIFGFSLYDLALAEVLSEVEPFKTSIILKFVRDWPFVVFAVLLLIAGLFIERFYCRYLCPLGAALAVPAKLRIFDWLRRYKTCGNPCQRCAKECPVQAIHPEGDIDPNECIQCLHCQMLYNHETKCPHLIERNARRKRGSKGVKQAPVAMAKSVSKTTADGMTETTLQFVRGASTGK